MTSKYELDLAQFKSPYKLEVVKSNDWPTYLIEYYPFVSSDGPSEHVMDFRVYEFNAYDPNAKTWCLGPNMLSMQENNTTVENADVYLSGAIKWDGCVNWSFGEQDVAEHYCGLDEARTFLKLWERLYEIAAREIPAWDGD